MKTRVGVIIVSLFILVFNIFLFLPLTMGFFKYSYDTPDRNPPLNLTQDVFGNLATTTSLIFLFVSSILLIYLIFRGQKLKAVMVPAFLSVSIFLLYLFVRPNYTVTSESKIPKDDFYYWHQTRESDDEIKYIRWKRSLNNEESKWELDSLSIEKR